MPQAATAQAPPFLPSPAPAAGGAITTSEVYLPELSSDIMVADDSVRGYLAFELIQRAWGSGRNFGQVEGVPHVRVEFIDANGDSLTLDNRSGVSVTPCVFRTDGEGVFNIPVNQSDACSLSRVPTNTDRLRFYGESQAPDGPPYRVTHGDSFWSFETPCPNGGDDCYTRAGRRQMMNERLDTQLDCVRTAGLQASNPPPNLLLDPTTCARDGYQMGDIGDQFAGMLAATRRFREEVRVRRDEWQNADNAGDYLRDRMDRQIELMRQNVELTREAAEHQVELVRSELAETRIAFNHAMVCAQRCKNWQLACRGNCWLQFTYDQIQSKVEFLQDSLTTWSSVALSYVHLYARLSYALATEPIALVLWLAQNVSDMALVDRLAEIGYSIIATGELMIDKAHNIAQIVSALADDFGSVENFMALRVMLDDLITILESLEAWNGARAGVHFLEVIERLLAEPLYHSVIARLAVANEFLGFTPERQLHQVELPVLGVESAVALMGGGETSYVSLPIMSTAFATANSPLEPERHLVQGWVMADILYQAERVRKVLRSDESFTSPDPVYGTNIFEARERKSRGVEIVWPTTACGAACYLGQDFDSLGLPPLLSNGTEIYLTPNVYTANPTQTTLWNNNSGSGPFRHTTSHEMGHYVLHVLQGIDQPVFRDGYSFVDVGHHAQCDWESTSPNRTHSTHGAFQEGFATFIGTLAHGRISPSLRFSSIVSEVDFLDLRSRLVGPPPARVSWAGAPAWDADNDGLIDLDEGGFFRDDSNTNSGITNMGAGTAIDTDGDGWSDGVEVFLGTDWGNPSIGTPFIRRLEKGREEFAIPASYGSMGDRDNGWDDAYECVVTGPNDEVRISSFLFSLVRRVNTGASPVGTRSAGFVTSWVEDSFARHACRSALGAVDCAPGMYCQQGDVSSFDTMPRGMRSFPAVSGTALAPGAAADGICMPQDEDSFDCSVSGCPYTQVCSTTGSCEQACLTDVDCPSGQVCGVGGMCEDFVGSCEDSPRVCRRNSVCNPYKGKCETIDLSVNEIMGVVANEQFALSGPFFNSGNSDPFSPNFGPPDDVCDLQENLQAALVHDLRCSVSANESDCIDEARFLVDALYAYHTIDPRGCTIGDVDDDWTSRSAPLLSQSNSADDGAAAREVLSSAEAYSPRSGGHDSDRDGKIDSWDGCKDDYDPFADEFDLTACDADFDAIINTEDNCPNDWNPYQRDCDKDGVGNVCDPSPNVQECSELYVIDDNEEILLDVDLFSNNPATGTARDLVWKRLVLPPFDEIQEEVEAFYRRRGQSVSSDPCLDHVALNEEVFVPVHTIHAPNVHWTPSGYGSGFNAGRRELHGQSDTLMFHPEYELPVQFVVEWLDPTTGQEMKRCSQVILPEIGLGFGSSSRTTRVGAGTKIELPQHYYYIADPTGSTGSPLLYIGRRGGRELLDAAQIDLSELGERYGVVGRFVSPDPEDPRGLRGSVYLYGGRLPDGTIKRDVWKFDIPYWKSPSPLELVREDTGGGEDGIAAGFDGWLARNVEGDVLIVGGVGPFEPGNVEGWRVFALGMDDGSALQVPRGREFDMRESYVLDAPQVQIGTRIERDSDCLYELLPLAHAHCPKVERVVQACSDPSEIPCGPTSSSWVEYTYETDLTDPSCQLFLAACPETITALYGVELNSGTKVRGTENHTPPDADLGQIATVVSSYRQVLLFGGRQSLKGKVRVFDTLHRYDLDGGYYVEVLPRGIRPPARAWASAVWVEESQELFIFGGSDQNDLLFADLWKIAPFQDDPVWIPVEDPNGVLSSSGRVKGTLGWDADREEFYLVGGGDIIAPSTGEVGYGSSFPAITRFRLSEDGREIEVPGPGLCGEGVCSEPFSCGQVSTLSCDHENCSESPGLPLCESEQMGDVEGIRHICFYECQGAGSPNPPSGWMLRAQSHDGELLECLTHDQPEVNSKARIESRAGECAQDEVLCFYDCLIVSPTE